MLPLFLMDFSSRRHPHCMQVSSHAGSSLVNNCGGETDGLRDSTHQHPDLVCTTGNPHRLGWRLRGENM